MLIEKFVEFYDNLIKSSQLTKENLSKKKNQHLSSKYESINDYNLNDKSKAYIEKHITTLIDTTINKFVENNNSNQKYSYYLKFVQNIYCDISDFSNCFINFKPLKMVLKLYFIIMRTYYYNNQKLEKIFISQETFTTFIDYFFKEIFLYAINIYPNIDINNKKSILESNIIEEIYKSFIGKELPFIKNDEETKLQIPMNILYNISDYRHDIMKDIQNKQCDIKKYFEKQEKSLKIKGNNNDEKNKENIYLSIIIYFLNEIKERYFVDRFIKYLELDEGNKKIILNNINII